MDFNLTTNAPSSLGCILYMFIVYTHFSNSLIIHEAKTKENHKRDGFGNMIKHLHKLAKVSPEVRICLRSCIKHSH